MAEAPEPNASPRVPLISSAPIGAVSHLRVHEAQPPTSTNQGLDFERCAALHNAILQHGWASTGRKLDEMPRTTWWETYVGEGADGDTQDILERLPASLHGFLKRAFLLARFPDQPDDNSFFYGLVDLASPTQMFDVLGGFDEGHLCLYLTDDRLSEVLVGMMCVVPGLSWATEVAHMMISQIRSHRQHLRLRRTRAIQLLQQRLARRLAMAGDGAQCIHRHDRARQGCSAAQFYR